MKRNSVVWVVQRWSEPDAEWVVVGARATRKHARIDAETWRGHVTRVVAYVPRDQE